MVPCGYPVPYQYSINTLAVCYPKRPMCKRRLGVIAKPDNMDTLSMAKGTTTLPRTSCGQVRAKPSLSMANATCMDGQGHVHDWPSLWASKRKGMAKLTPFPWAQPKPWPQPSPQASP